MNLQQINLLQDIKELEIITNGFKFKINKGKDAQYFDNISLHIKINNIHILLYF